MNIDATPQSAGQEPMDCRTLAATVIVERGVVALNGHVQCRLHEPLDVDATGAAHGDDGLLEVRAPLTFARVDVQIAQTAAAALRRALPWSHDEYARLSVQNGHLTLDGQFEWRYQRERARAAIGSVPGAVTVLDCAPVSANTDPRRIKARIQEAFRARAAADASPLSTAVSASAAVSGDEALKRTLLSWAAPQDSKPAV
jgi:osmotically-inducible protein OsmY